jgi:HD-GYP domain-containing protein (c-di-GMP phosphodiesterase class II)
MPWTRPTPQIELAELVSALSYALDLTEGQPAGHGIRCCWIGMNIGRVIRLSEGQLSDLYYTLLIKDVGCSSNAARLCQLYLGDDRAIKRDYKLVDSSIGQVLNFVLAHTGMKAGLAERFRAMVHMALNGGELARELIETRCQRGAEIARRMRFSDEVAQGILDLDEHWNGKGQPLGRKGAEISLFARIALLAQVVDVFHTSAGPEAALAEVRSRSGVWFDPALVEAFATIAQDPAFWSTLASPGLPAIVVALQSNAHAEPVDDDYLDEIAAAFATVVDAKSPYTSGHSDRVALFSDLIAEQLGFGDAQRRFIKRTALLHDIGKLGISNEILDKPGKLDAEEWAEIRRHPALSEEILSRISVFRNLARIAGAHHERLDGQGYPRGLEGEQICIETRVITTADIFDALTADRPYRQAMGTGDALALMERMVGTQLDADCFVALKRAIASLEPDLRRPLEAA